MLGLKKKKNTLVSELNSSQHLNADKRVREPEHNAGVQFTCSMDHNTFVNARVCHSQECCIINK